VKRGVVGEIAESEAGKICVLPGDGGSKMSGGEREKARREEV
jgi:hypothetical protein